MYDSHNLKNKYIVQLYIYIQYKDLKNKINIYIYLNVSKVSQ